MFEWLRRFHISHLKTTDQKFKFNLLTLCAILVQSPVCIEEFDREFQNSKAYNS